MNNFEHKSFEEQIDIFKKRNLKFQNPDRAKETLSKISYYKIKEFAKPLAIIQNGMIDYQNNSFEYVISRYYQDKNLRHTLFHLIEDIEVSVKTTTSFVLGKKYGAYGYLSFDLWCNKQEYCKHFILHKQNEFIHELRKSLNRQEIPEVLEKLKSGKNKDFPPIWLAINFLSFGQMVNLLEMMSYKNLTEISNSFNCNNTELLSWLKCLNLIRNMCAHNANVIDLKLRTTPVIRESWKKHLFEYKKDVFSNRIALPILIVLHFMHSINPKHKKIYEMTSSIYKLAKDERLLNYYGLSSTDIFKKTKNN